MLSRKLRRVIRSLTPSPIITAYRQAKESLLLRGRFRDPEPGFIKSPEYTLRFCINMIDQRRHGAYVRFNDGDLSILSGGSNRHQSANATLASEMRKALAIVDDSFAKGLGVSSDRYGFEPGMVIGSHKWPDGPSRSMLFSCYEHFIGSIVYSSTALHHALVHHHQIAIDFFRLLRQRNVIFVGGEHNSKAILQTLLKPRKIITIPSRDAFKTIDDVENLIREAKAEIDQYSVVVLSCGAMAKPLAARMFNDHSLDVFCFDLGSVLEVFRGETRWTWVRIANLPQTHWDDFLESVKRAT